jgi:acyl-CoA synthetase (AMP-forming)/AMP-acid ligase II
MFKMKFKSPNLVTQLQSRTSRLPACIYLEDGRTEISRLTYRDLDKKARIIAAYLQTETQVGDRVLLACPAGIDFIAAFIGCLYAGVVVVPVHCPAAEFETSLASINAIALDANISGILTTQDYMATMENACATLLSTRNCFIANTDNLDAKLATPFHVTSLNDNTIAYLQYTAGCTDKPKAVVVRHKNLNHALKYTAKVWSYSKKSVTCTWMSPATLQGLLFGVLLPLYSGATAIIMPPETVRKNPLAWLQAITKYRVTHSGALNSGYDSCVREIDPVD